MGLDDRLLPDLTSKKEQDERITQHTWGAALREYARGKLTRAALITGLGIKAGLETTDLDVMLDGIDRATGTAAKLDSANAGEDVVALANEGIAYASKAGLRTRFGF